MMTNYTLIIITESGQREIEFTNTTCAYAIFDYYANNKGMFGIKEITLVDKDALKMVTA